MKSIVKSNKIILVLICFSFSILYAQNLKDLYPDSSFINQSYPNNININHPDGSLYQDLKRATAVLITLGLNKAEPCTCTLLNNTSQDKTPYVLTAAHCIGGANIGSQLEVLISFDYELAHANRRGSDQEDGSTILEVDQLTVTILQKDIKSDLALLRIEDGNGLLHNKNIYASGWNTSLSLQQISSNISHPNTDHKKVFSNPTEVFFDNTFFTKKNNQIVRRPNSYLIDGWQSEGGASGSGLYNQYDELIAVYNGLTRVNRNSKYFSDYRTLSNSWYHLDNTIPSLSTYLDPSGNWLSSVPGGYIGDLQPLLNTNFELTILPQESLVSEQIFIQNNLIFKNIDKSSKFDWEKILGIKINNPNDSEVSQALMYLEVDTNDLEASIFKERLIYGSKADIDVPSNTGLSGFRLKSWNCNAILPQEQNCNRIGTPGSGLWQWMAPNQGESTDIKESYIRAVVAEANKDLNTIYRLKNNIIPAKVYLHNLGSENVDVQAISYPGDVPRNALQLFKPHLVLDHFRSIKYPESKGLSTDNLFIDKIKFEIKAYVYQGNNEPCEESDYITLNEIDTGNNGGYLNLVNSNYKIDNVILSDSRCTNKNKLKTTLYPNTAFTIKNYGSWVDYNRLPLGLNYSFTEASPPGTSNEEEIVLNHEIPDENSVTFPTADESIPFQARYRVGIGNQFLTSTSTVPLGEVEDYLLNVKTSENISKSFMLTKLIPALILMTGALVGNGQCLPEGTDIEGGLDSGDAASPAQGTDQTFPVHQLPFFGIGGDEACFDILDLINTYFGQNAIIFDGNLYMGVAEGSEVVHAPATEKTISIDFMLQDTATTTDEIIFEEGGGSNGISILKNNNKIEFGVKIDNHLVAIESTSNLVINEMTNVTVVFDNGIMQLYIDGILEESTNQFITDWNITSIPEHLDEAALGGTQGLNIWDTIIANYNGLIDLFAYWNQALSPEVIAIIAQNTTKQNNSFKNTSEQAGKASFGNSEIILDKLDFSVFPNPVSDKLNILVEVRQEGPLEIGIYDLNGRRVYNLKKDKINQGDQLIIIPIESLHAGNYILKITTGKTANAVKIVVKK